MKNIVIAAGYATRLGELTKNFPKPLLQIGESTILGRMLDDIDRIPEVDEHVIITNHKFAPIFDAWVEEQHYTKPITVMDDGTSTNETRLGAVCDLLFAMDRLDIDDDMLVVAADNILEFSFREYIGPPWTEMLNLPVGSKGWFCAETAVTPTKRAAQIVINLCIFVDNFNDLSSTRRCTPGR